MFWNTHKKDILIALKWLTSLTVSHSFALRNNVLFRYLHPMESHNVEAVKCHPSVWSWLPWGQGYRLDGPHQISCWQCSQIHWHTIWIRDCFLSQLWLVFAHNVIHQRDIICILFVPSWILPLKSHHLHLFLFSDKKTIPQGSQWRGSPLNGQIYWNNYWHWTNICVQR